VVLEGLEYYPEALNFMFTGGSHSNLLVHLSFFAVASKPQTVLLKSHMLVFDLMSIPVSCV
jgi:hypothetical protein